MEKRMRLFGIVAVALVALAALAAPQEAAAAKDLRDGCQEAIDLFKTTDDGIRSHFKTAYAYAIYPKIGKGGFGLGGAHGNGLVYRGGRTVGKTSMTQFTVGFQFGGQVYQEVIFFQTKEAFEKFRGGNFEFSAQVSAIAAAAGASADAKYEHGVLVFTLGKAGLMYEASVGGQKFSYHDI